MSEEKNSSEITSYGRDTPVGRPDRDGRAGVFITTDDFDLENNGKIRKGAGLAGYGNPDGTLTIYFEANRFDDSSLHKWENKVRKAYDRLVMGAPTVSKEEKMNPKMVEQVGHIDGIGLHLKQPERLADWLEQSNAADTAPESADITWKNRNN